MARDRYDELTDEAKAASEELDHHLYFGSGADLALRLLGHEIDCAISSRRLTEPRLDEKHVRSYEFDVRRGRHRALFVWKSRGELTLVGPFRTGKTEGPCRSFPTEAEAEIAAAVVEFVSSFLEEAATP